MVPVGQTYRPEGRIDARSILSATILGVMTAIFAAFMVWLWELSPIPTLVLLTPLIQGVVIGMVLSFLIGRLKLRHPKLMATVAFACGLGSVGLIHYAHYLHFLDQVGTALRAEVEADDDVDPAKKQEVLAKLGGNTSAMADLFLIQKTGHRGFLGSMMLRAEQGVRIKSANLTGWGLWGLWGFEALMVAGVASSMARGRAAVPFCEDCGAWCSQASSPLILAGESAPGLVEAVRTDDSRSATDLVELPTDPATLGGHGTRLSLYSCDGCDQTFADVNHYQTVAKKNKTETKTQTLLKQVRVSPAMLSILRGPVVVPGVSPPHEVAEHHVIDAPAALEERDL